MTDIRQTSSGWLAGDSGPWRTREAAEAAAEGDYDRAHRLHGTPPAEISRMRRSLGLDAPGRPQPGA